MSFETSPESQLPVVDKRQVYGASLLRAAMVLEQTAAHPELREQPGAFASITLQRADGRVEIVIPSGAANLVSEVKRQFNIQEIAPVKYPLPSIEETVE